MESQVVYFYLSPLPKVLMVMIIYDFRIGRRWYPREGHSIDKYIFLVIYSDKVMIIFYF